MASPGSVAGRRLVQGVMKGVQIAPKALQEPTLSHLVAEIDRARKAQCVDPAVALHRDTVQSQECSPVHPARIHLMLQDPEAATGQEGPDPGHQCARHRVLQVLANLAGGSLRGLERDVTGESFDHDYIHSPLTDLVALDVAAVVQGKFLVLEDAVGLLDLVRP